MSALSKRLLAAASFVEKGSVIADVGCDHAYLSLYLLEKGIAEHAFLIDVRKEPLLRAEKNAGSHLLTGAVDIILSDGLKELPAYIGENGIYPDTVIMTGMGGPLILSLIQEAPKEVKERVRHWILSPQSELKDFRAGLSEAGLEIRDELICREQGKYYFIMRAEPFDGESVEKEPLDGVSAEPLNGSAAELLTKAELCYGRPNILRRDPLLKAMIEKDKAKLEGLLRDKGLPGSRRGELEHKLNMMKGVLRVYEMP